MSAPVARFVSGIARKHRLDYLNLALRTPSYRFDLPDNRVVRVRQNSTLKRNQSEMVTNVNLVSLLAKIGRSPQAEGRYWAFILQRIFAIAGAILPRPDVKGAEEMPQ